MAFFFIGSSRQPTVILIATSLGHIHLATLDVKGGLADMIDGWVDVAWARTYHHC